MHWTAFLAYRRLPANAQVVGDVHCISCGYNLRGLRARGNCPECGNRVADSLFVLAKPEVVALALRSFSNSYYTLLILPLGCAGVGWAILVVACFIAGGALYRALHAGELRFRAQLRNSAALDSRVRLLVAASVIEAVAALLWAAGTLLALNLAAAPFPLVPIAAILWLYAALATAAAAGWLGLSLASILGYAWMAVEFKIQLAMVCLTGVIGGLLLALLAVATSPGVALILAILLIFLCYTMFFLTWLSLHHVANAAEQEYGTWEEMLDSDRVAIVPDE